jgi:hypothetical protein
MRHRRRFSLSALPLLGVSALLSSACSSSYSIPVIEQYSIDGVVPTNTSCEVSGGTTTASGSIAGPATVHLLLTAQNAAEEEIGNRGRASRSVPSGTSWNWTIRINTAGVMPARCTVDSTGSVRST